MSYPNNLERILKYLNPNITGETLEKVSLHPEYPSLNTLSFVFDECRIRNLAVKLDDNQLHEIDLPSVAHCLSENEAYFVVINAIKGNNVYYYDTSEGEKTESLDEFKKKWKGVILLLVVDNKSEEKNYKEKRQKEIYIQAENVVTYTIIGFIFFMRLFYLTEISHFFIYCFYGAGTLVSVILIKSEGGEKNEIVRKLCAINRNANCDAVLQSKASRLFGWLSWSEIGLFYFSGSYLSILFLDTNKNVITILFFLTLLALPYVLFSLYYQSVVIKQWCTLCLIVQGLLIGLFLSFFFSDIVLKNILGLDFQRYSLVLYCFLAPVVIWFILKHLVQKKEKLREVEKEMYFYKLNSDLFLGLLDKQKKEEITEFANEISFGNLDSGIILTMVSNPFCQPCGLAHKEVVDLVEYFDVRLNIRFIGKNQEQKIVINHLLNLALTDSIGKAIDDWYEIRDYDKWAANYPVDLINLENYAYEWAEISQIEYTPTFFINGRKVVKPYSASDLKYHFRSLLEHL